MKLTSSQLRRIIKEEINRVVAERTVPGDPRVSRENLIKTYTLLRRTQRTILLDDFEAALGLSPNEHLSNNDFIKAGLDSLRDSRGNIVVVPGNLPSSI